MGLCERCSNEFVCAWSGDGVEGCSKFEVLKTDGKCASPSKLNTATDFLRRAADIMEERAKQYDKPDGERSMAKTVQAFNTITGHSLTEAEGWLLMQILKDVRLFQRPGYHADSAEDCVAYSSLKAEAKAKEA